MGQKACRPQMYNRQVGISSPVQVIGSIAMPEPFGLNGVVVTFALTLIGTSLIVAHIMKD